jgi:hypothetical protein
VQRKARCAAIALGAIAGQSVLLYIIWGSGGVYAVPACIAYTAYTMTGITSEQRRTKYM